MTAFDAAILADAPALYLRCQDTTGPTALDSSGNGRNGTYTATGVTYGAAGVLAGEHAVTLDGAAGYITLPASVNGSGLAAYVLEAVVYKAASDGSFPRLISGENPGSSNAGMELGIAGDGSKVFAVAGNGSAYLEVDAFPSGSYLGQWLHIVARFASNTLSVYVNGALGASGALAGPLGANGHAPRVGASATFTGDLFAGTVAYAAIYLADLSPARIRAH